MGSRGVGGIVREGTAEQPNIRTAELRTGKMGLGFCWGRHSPQKNTENAKKDPGSHRFAELCRVRVGEHDRQLGFGLGGCW